MTLVKLCLLGFLTNMKYDAGKQADFPIEMVRAELQSHRASALFKRSLDAGGLLSMLDDDDWRWIDEEMAAVSWGVDYRRKMGVEHEGLSFLLATIFELIQNHMGLENASV